MLNKIILSLASTALLSAPAWAQGVNSIGATGSYGTSDGMVTGIQAQPTPSLGPTSKQLTNLQLHPTQTMGLAKVYGYGGGAAGMVSPGGYVGGLSIPGLSASGGTNYGVPLINTAVQNAEYAAYAAEGAVQAAADTAAELADTAYDISSVAGNLADSGLLSGTAENMANDVADGTAQAGNAIDSFLGF